MGSSQTRTRTCVFCISRQILYHWAHKEAQGSGHLRSSLSRWGASWWSWKRGSICFLWGEPPSVRNRKWEQQGWSILPPLFHFLATPGGVPSLPSIWAKCCMYWVNTTAVSLVFLWLIVNGDQCVMLCITSLPVFLNQVSFSFPLPVLCLHLPIKGVSTLILASGSGVLRLR